MNKLLYLCALMGFCGTVLSGCFTGVENTPRITDRDIKRRDVRVSAEKQYMSDIVPQAPSRWQHGKELYVTDNRISLIFTPMVGGASQYIPDSLANTIITFQDASFIKGLTGDDEVQLTFKDLHGNILVYRPIMTRRAFEADSALQIPFTVDVDMIANANGRIAGNTYYILTPRRFRDNGTETTGLRYVPVNIVNVVPGNVNYPLRVRFAEHGVGDTLSLFMTVGNSRIATRNFETLFSFDNPRKLYPSIEDDTWAIIQKSQLRDGMTPDECRLALGAPTEYLRIPTTGGMAERWSYGNGVYLFFEDGRLSRYRH